MLPVARRLLRLRQSRLREESGLDFALYVPQTDSEAQDDQPEGESYYVLSYPSNDLATALSTKE
jgi:hypothetical protein